MARTKKENVEAVACVLDCFDFIPQTTKNKFVKYAEKYNISQEDLLKLSIEAVVKNKVPFKVKTTIELD